MSGGIGLVRRRAGGQRTLLAAATAVLLPALVLVTLIRMHAAVAERDGVRHALSGLPAEQRAVSVRYVADLAWPAAADKRRDLASDVRHQLADAFGEVSAGADEAVGSVRYAVGTPGSGSPEAVYFLSGSRLADHVTLLSGGWPKPVAADAARGAAFQAVVPREAAERNHWKTGDTFAADAKLGGGPSTVTIAGVYRPRDPESPYWQRMDPFRGTGRQQQEQIVFGPLLVDPSVTDSDALLVKELDFLAVPDFAAVTPEGAARTAVALGDFDTTAATANPVATQSEVTDALSPLMAGIDADRSISARLILLPIIELALLALTAMLLTTRLLAEHRRETDGLLRARGASLPALAGVGLAEGLALALPLALLAPFTARVLLRQISDTSVSALRTGEVPITPDLWAVALGGGVAAAVLLGVASLRSSGGFVEARRDRTRSSARTAIQRNGADVLAALFGAGALWEVSQFGGGKAHSGSLELPLVVAPSVLLLAGALLSLRLLPLIVGLLEHLASRRRGAVSALAGWRIGRTARFYAAPMILLIMAVAVGVQAVVFVGSAGRSAADQAAYTVGADVRVSGLPAGRDGLAGQLAAVPGTGPALLGVRDVVGIGGGSTIQVSALGVDPARAAEVVPLRPDLADQPWSRTVGALAADGWDAHGELPVFQLPGRPEVLSLDVTYGSGTQKSALGAARFQAMVDDAYGMAALVDFGTVAAPDGGVHTLTADLVPADGTLAYPLRLRSLLVSYSAPNCPLYFDKVPFSDHRCFGDTGPPVGDAEQVTVSAGRLKAGGQPVTQPAGTGPVLADPVTPATPGSGAPSGTVLRTGSDGLDLFTLTERSGFGIDAQPQNSHLVQLARTGDTDPGAVVPAVASRGLLDSLRVKVGDILPVDAFGGSVRVHFVAAVEHLPGQEGDQPSMLLPIGFLDQVAARNRAAVGTAEWWVRAAPGTAPAQLADRIRALSGSSEAVATATVLDRQTSAAAISRDPMRAGVKLTLVIAAVAALLFILIGFALHSVIAVRERATELALLNALGLSRRRTALMLLAEQALLVLLGVAAGGALAAVTVKSVLPLMILTDVGKPPVPRPLVVFDLPLLAGAGAAAVLFLLGTVAAVVLTRRRTELGKALRSGEDR